MFTTAEPITGNIVVTAPPKCTVWHYGVVAKLDATMCEFLAGAAGVAVARRGVAARVSRPARSLSCAACFESLSTRCLFTQEVQVAAPGYVTCVWLVRSFAWSAEQASPLLASRACVAAALSQFRFDLS
jgi:hypothetical protein